MNVVTRLHSGMLLRKSLITTARDDSDEVLSFYDLQEVAGTMTVSCDNWLHSGMLLRKSLITTAKDDSDEVLSFYDLQEVAGTMTVSCDNCSTISTRLQVILLPTKPIPIESVAAAAEYSVIDTASQAPFSSETTPTDVAGILHIATPPHDESHVFAYSFVTLGVLALVAVAMFMIFCIRKRNKFDRIRHHLMPMYTFDPADDEARWEADLLEDDREQQIALNQTVHTENRPKLKFHSHGLET